MLSLKRYAWLCVLGGEVAYFICLLGGYLPMRTERATEIHKALFGTLPGFTWGNPLSIILGAVYVFMLAWIFGAYIAWMHNTSLIQKPERTREQKSSAELSPGPIHSH
jgi:hypothetical protein